MEVLIKQLINGITFGSIYGLIAIGYPQRHLLGLAIGRTVARPAGVAG